MLLAISVILFIVAAFRRGDVTKIREVAIWFGIAWIACEMVLAWVG